MLHKKYVDGIRFLRAWYSETRNDACLKHNPTGIISFHVNNATQIIAATEYTVGFQQNPYFGDSVAQGELHLTAARIGNYDTNKDGLVGTIKVSDWAKLREEKDIESMEELLMQFNVLDGENDVKAEVERFKEYMKPYLITPEDLDQEPTTIKLEQFKTFASNDDNNGAIPIRPGILKSLEELRIGAIGAKLKT